MKPMSFDFKSRRSMVVARRGMVAAGNPIPWWLKPGSTFYAWEAMPLMRLLQRLRC